MSAWLAEVVIVLGASVVTWMAGHQSSHLVAIQAGRAELNLAIILWMGVTSLLGFVFLIWYAYETTLIRALVLVVFAQVGRFLLVALERPLGLLRAAWKISLGGLAVVPIVLLVMVWAVTAITARGPG